MKYKMSKIKIIFTIILLTLTVSLVSAQDDPPPPPEDSRIDSPRRGERLAELLGLSAEQKLKIRQLNQQKRPLMRQAQENVKKAKDELDQTIYDDQTDELTIQTKVRAVIEAQAEVLKIRTSTEFAIRNVLTPDQLVKFREIRDNAKKIQQRIQRRNRRLQQQRRLNRNRRNNNQRSQPIRSGSRPL